MLRKKWGPFYHELKVKKMFREEGAGLKCEPSDASKGKERKERDLYRHRCGDGDPAACRAV